MEKQMTLSEKMNLREEVRIVRKLILVTDLDIFKLMTLKNSLSLADSSKKSKEVLVLIESIDKRIRRLRGKS